MEEFPSKYEGEDKEEENEDSVKILDVIGMMLKFGYEP